jgi:murein DD-endopeptidase MepM/ murein hydrolase activator NlpD
MARETAAPFRASGLLVVGICVSICVGCASSASESHADPAVTPSIAAQPANQTVTAGQSATFSVLASGTPPPTYQWRKNGANISGANAARYAMATTTAADNGSTFDVIVSNSTGAVTSNTATLIVTSTISNVNFGNGFPSSGLTLNGSAVITGTRLRLTDGGTGEAGSGFLNTLVNVQSFITDFNFQVTNANGDGFTFVIQRASPTDLGAGGESLGYGAAPGSGGIGNSVAVGFQLYTDSEVSRTGMWTNGASPGATPGTDTTLSAVNLHSSDVMNVHITYDGTTLAWIITDTVTNASFGISFPVDIPSLVGGNAAYVGFTGGTGSLTATQDIVNWTYNPVVVAPFEWPVDTPVTYASSACGGANDYATYCSKDPIFGQYHTGIDVCPQSPGCAVGNSVYASSTGVVEVAMVVSDSTETLCDGSSDLFYQVNDNGSNLGNVIVIAHPNGKFTLYGHLDCIWPGIIPGVAVDAGARIGNMGHSAFGQRLRTFTAHTHFETKDRGVLGDPTNRGYSGYTTDVPDGYGYHDARTYLNPFTASILAPTAVKVVASTAQSVRTGPDVSFALLSSITPSQEYVATATSGAWYRIDLPNVNGAVAGWVEGTSGTQTLITLDSKATVIQVSGASSSGLDVEAGASSSPDLVSWDQTFSNCVPVAKIWNGQRFVTIANQNGFDELYLPVNYYFSSGSGCAEPAASGPSTGWAPSSFLK